MKHLETVALSLSSAMGGAAIGSFFETTTAMVIGAVIGFVIGFYTFNKKSNVKNS